MNKADIHYLNCSDEDCEVAACIGRRDYEQKILNLETQLEAINKSKEHDAISCFDKNCVKLPCLFTNFPNDKDEAKANTDFYNQNTKPKKRFKVKERYLISFDEADFLDEVFGIKALEEALRNGADDVTGNKYHEDKFKEIKKAQRSNANCICPKPKNNNEPFDGISYNCPLHGR